MEGWILFTWQGLQCWKCLSMGLHLIPLQLYGSCWASNDNCYEPWLWEREENFTVYQYFTWKFTMSLFSMLPEGGGYTTRHHTFLEWSTEEHTACLIWLILWWFLVCCVACDIFWFQKMEVGPLVHDKTVGMMLYMFNNFRTLQFLLQCILATTKFREPSTVEPFPMRFLPADTWGSHLSGKKYPKQPHLIVFLFKTEVKNMLRHKSMIFNRLAAKYATGFYISLCTTLWWGN